jgi:hypothetical protein
MAGSGRPWDDVALCTPPDIGVRNNPARLLLAPTTVEEAFAFPPPLLDITPLLSLALPALDWNPKNLSENPQFRNEV